MPQLHAGSISYKANPEDDTASLCFAYENGYLSISRIKDAADIYLEKDAPANGQYWERDPFELSLRNGYFMLSLNLNNNRLLKYIADNRLNVDLYGDTQINFEPLPIEEFKALSGVVKKIFSR